MTQTNSSRSKRVTLVDIYRTYEHKKNIKSSKGTVPTPFIPHSECTDNKLSADWHEWEKIIALYIEKLKFHLEEGNSIDLGSRLGEFHLIKAKAHNGFTDFKKSKEAGKVIKFKNNTADGHYILASWARRNIPLKLKTFWSVKLNRKWVRSIYDRCGTDYTKIYKIRNA